MIQKIFSMLIVLFACTGKQEKQLPQIYSTEAGAIGGYDPVAFFAEQQPIKGSNDFTYTWQEATWHFSSANNLDTFKAEPEKYIPQYGGYCAYGTADGHLSPTQPETWTILDDKLYFNYNMKVKEKWTSNQRNYIEQADKNWPGLSGK